MRSIEVLANLNSLIAAVQRIHARRDGVPVRSAKHSRSVSVNLEAMLQMYRTGSTLEQIGQRFNVTRERIRQILKPYGGISMRPVKHPAPPSEEQIRKRFHKQMKLQMWSIGVRKCAECPIWSEKVTKSLRRCAECNRKRSHVNYHKRGGKQAKAEWQRANPDKVRTNSLRYARKHPEKVSKSSNKGYLKLKSTPEGREKLREYQKRAEANRKAKRLNTQ